MRVGCRAPLRSAHHGKVFREYLLRRALQLAVLNNVLAANPVRDVQLIRSTSTSTPTGAEALTADQLREPLIKLRVSETCAKSDLVTRSFAVAMLTHRRKLPSRGSNRCTRPDQGPAAPAAGAVMSVADRVPTLVAPRILASCAERYRVW